MGEETNPATPRPMAVRAVMRLCDEVIPLSEGETDLAEHIIDAAITADPLLSAAGEMAEALRDAESMFLRCRCFDCAGSGSLGGECPRGDNACMFGKDCAADVRAALKRAGIE